MTTISILGLFDVCLLEQGPLLLSISVSGHSVLFSLNLNTNIYQVQVIPQRILSVSPNSFSSLLQSLADQ